MQVPLSPTLSTILNAYKPFQNNPNDLTANNGEALAKKSAEDQAVWQGLANQVSMVIYVRQALAKDTIMSAAVAGS